jgi:hypothetical protein
MVTDPGSWGNHNESPLMARSCQVEEGRACPLCPGSSDIDLFGDRQGIVDLDPKIPNRTLDLSMAKQKLDGTQIACSTVN